MMHGQPNIKIRSECYPNDSLLGFCIVYCGGIVMTLQRNVKQSHYVTGYKNTDHHLGVLHKLANQNVTTDCNYT